MNQQALVQQFTDLIGTENVHTQPEVAARNSGYCRTSQQAGLLVTPTSTEQVAAVVRLAAEAGRPVVPQGGLTGLVDGTASEAQDIIVSFEKMKRVLRVDADQSVIVCEAGVVLQKAQEAVAPLGMTTGVDIPSRGSCTLGGMVSTNAGGVRVIRYGMTRENILGLKVVTASGEILDMTNTLMKNNAGPDLKQNYIGTEGTLGLVTEVVMRLVPLPAREQTALVALDSSEHLIPLLSRCRRELGGQLLSFEVLWGEFYRVMVDRPGYESKPVDTGYPLYAIIETGIWSDSEDQGVSFDRLLETVMNDGLVADGTLAASETERELIWRAREDSDHLSHVHDSIRSYDVGFELTDIVAYAELVQQQFTANWPQHSLYVFGHLGDGNLHLVLGLDTAGQAPTEQLIKDIDALIYRCVGEFGNSTISAEHGIGTQKKPYLELSRTTAQIDAMKQLKAALDPAGVLNRGKIV